MHRVFSIPDYVVHEIAAHLDRRSLAAVARTARCLEEPAYARLYKTAGTDYIRRIIKILLYPSPSLATGTDARNRCISQTQLVRHFHMDWSPSWEQWSDLQAAIAVLRRPLYPFPCLRTLDICITRTAHPMLLTTADSLLCPSLRDLRITVVLQVADIAAWEGRIIGLFDGLGEKASHISRLAVDIGPEHEALLDFEVRLTNALGEACRRLPLVELRMETLPIITLQLLQNLEFIDSLKSIILLPSPFSITFSDVGPCGHGTALTHGFRSLREVVLRGTAAVAEIVTALNGAGLQTLVIEIAQWGAHVSHLMEAVRYFASTLTILKIEECVSDHYELTSSSYRTHTIPTHALAGLSSCSLMEVFHFKFYSPTSPVIDLQNLDLAQLARSWPLLEELEINYGWSRQGAEPNIDIEVFVPFSLHCPRLSIIEIRPLSPMLDVKVPPCIVPPHHWKVLSITIPNLWEVLTTPALVTITQYLDALWGDIFLRVTCDETDNTRAMNEILSGLRTGRAMRVGSAWRMRHAGEPCLPSEITFDTFDDAWDTCPWEVVC